MTAVTLNEEGVTAVFRLEQTHVIKGSILLSAVALATALLANTEFDQGPLRPDQAEDSVAQRVHVKSIGKPVLTHKQELLTFLSSVTEAMLSMTCHERTTEYRNGKQKGVREDNIQLSPLGDAIYSNITWKHKNYRAISRVPHQAWGDYSLIFEATERLGVETQTGVDKANNGMLTAQLGLDQDHSLITFYGDRFPGSVGHSTTIELSRDRSTLTIYNVADDPIPGVRKADTLVTFTTIHIGDITTCLPEKSWDRNVYTDGTVDQWVSAYDSYKQFQARSTLIFSTP